MEEGLLAACSNEQCEEVERDADEERFFAAGAIRRQE